MKHRGQLWCRDVARGKQCRVGTAACLICCGGRGGVALASEQQLHHLQCRAFLRGVVQRQLSVLRDAVAGQPRHSECGGRKQRGQGERDRVETARTEAWAQRRYLIRCGESFRVGVEQELHHTERRALGGGVVQRKLLVLRTRRVAQHWSGRGNEVRPRRRGRATAHSSAATTGCGRRSICGAARLVRRRGSLTVCVEQQLHHLERRALGGSVVQGQL